MAILNWIGKEAVVNHDKEVPFKLLEKVSSASVGKESKNLIIHGDNLEALKGLMPFYKGKVKCIYIDPPYNTGNENWVYNDKVNSPKIREWLEKTVKIDDLTRHDKWLCMMYPRMKLLRDLLRDDGIIFISIDDNEYHNLRLIMEEIIPGGYVTTLHVQMSAVSGQKVRAAKKGNIVKNAEYVAIYSKSGNKNIGTRPLYDPIEYDTHYSIFLSKRKDGQYTESNLIDVIKDNEGLFNMLVASGVASIKNEKKEFSIQSLGKAYSQVDVLRNYIHENAGKIVRTDRMVDIEVNKNNLKTKTTYTHSHSNGKEYLYGIDRSGELKQRFLLSDKLKVADDFYKTYGISTMRGDWWPGFHLDMGNVSKEGDTLYLNGKKPIRLLKQLIKFSTDENDLILDSFAGSGSTGHAVLDLNAEEQSHRQFILIEMENEVAKKITAERIMRAIRKYEYKDGFEYCELAKPLFNEKGQINEMCSYDELASYIYFTETQTNIDKKKLDNPFVGESHETAYYLIYTGKNKNDLTRSILSKLKITGRAVVYADRCLVDEEDLKKKGIVFKQIPYEIKVY